MRGQSRKRPPTRKGKLADCCKTYLATWERRVLLRMDPPLYFQALPSCSDEGGRAIADYSWNRPVAGTTLYSKLVTYSRRRL
jgi:hypothetical protein